MSTTIYTSNGKILINGSNNKWLSAPEIDPFNPLGLPQNTVRVRTSDGNAPIKDTAGWNPTTYETATLVAGTSDVYDVYKSGTNFSKFLSGSTNVVEVLGANTTGITNMNMMFTQCSALTSVQVFDTSSATDLGAVFSGCTSLTASPIFDSSSATNMSSMFQGCSSLTTVPLLDTSSVLSMGNMFQNCYNVESGALALYQQASSQANPPTGHNYTFRDCGRDTVTGAAELAQIPSDWGGTAS